MLSTNSDHLEVKVSELIPWISTYDLFNDITFDNLGFQVPRVFFLAICISRPFVHPSLEFL